MELLLPLAAFAFVSSITPGPNNIMLTSSGMFFGFVRSIPHILGITVGMGMLLAFCALGVGQLFVAFPSLHVVLKVAGTAYLLVLAWKIRTIAVASSDGGAGRPMRFVEAAVFQFVNPKAWVMAITSVSAFFPLIEPLWLAVLVFCAVFCAINLPCVATWAGGGCVLREVMHAPRWRNAIGLVLAILTAYSALSIWL